MSEHISGVVTSGADLSPVKRKVRAFTWYPVDTGEVDGSGNPIYEPVFVAETESSEVDGSYDLDVSPRTDALMVVAFDEYGSEFQASTAYSVGDIIHPPVGFENGHVYECVIAGTSASSAPVWWKDDEDPVTRFIGTAEFLVRAFYQPIVHGPIMPYTV